MITVCCFSEMNIWADDGSVNSFLTSHVDYDKAKVVKYLESGEIISVCARHGIDCLTGEEISLSFKVMTDGEYVWCDFLPYHIMKYDIILPEGLVEKVASR